MGLSTKLIAGLALLAACGCVVPGNFINLETAPAAQPASVVAAWNPRVVYTPDTANAGVPSPGIAGRVYLFGSTPDFPMAGDGALFVELYDDTPRPGQTGSVKLEEWNFDSSIMRRLLKKDAIGMGYTVFLPWGSYRPDVKQVHLSLRFDSTHGSPLFAPSGSMTLDHNSPTISSPHMAAAGR